jgi:hypothetical protein
MLHFRAGELLAVNSRRAAKQARRAWLCADSMAAIADRQAT